MNIAILVTMTDRCTVCVDKSCRIFTRIIFECLFCNMFNYKGVLAKNVKSDEARIGGKMLL